MDFSITKNADADMQYFSRHMLETYSDKYTGYTINEEDSFITVHSSEAFTQGEKDAISAYYAALTTEDTMEQFFCKIFDYMSWSHGYDKCCPPTEVDYIRSLDIRLSPVITDEYKGEVREITYYESVTIDPTTGVQTGVTPVVKENFSYTRNTDLIAQHRLMTISWFLNDGTINTQTKIRQKYYTNEQAISEGVRRRTNIIDFMQIPLLGMMMQTIPCTYAEAVDQGGLFFEKYVVEVETYKFSPRQNTLQNAITADTEFAWLNNVIAVGPVTIRDYMIDQLDY